jgi:ABC-type transporter Mla subunit MlaD
LLIFNAYFNRFNSRTLDVDFVFDGVYLKLKTQLQRLIKDVVVDLGLGQEHSQQLAARQNVLEAELQQLLEREQQLQRTSQSHLQPVTSLRDLYGEEIETILMSVSQRANEAIQLIERSVQENGSKSMKDKLISLEDELTQTHIDNEDTWNLLETRCSEAIRKADTAVEESTYLASVVDAQREKIKMLEATIGVLSNTDNLEALQATIDQISAKVEKNAICLTEFQEECRRGIASLEGQVMPLVGSRTAIEKILKEVDKKVCRFSYPRLASIISCTF